MSELTVVILVSLKILFMYGAMKEDEVLYPLRKILENFVSLFPVKIQFYLRKPLFDCVFCMSSVWGLTFVFVPLPLWIDIILSVAGLNYLWSSVIGYLHEAKEQIEEGECTRDKIIIDVSLNEEKFKDTMIKLNELNGAVSKLPPDIIK
jgi:hypothetical protein